jgi:two-component system, LuxR family, response regulator FixJ
MNAVVHIVDDDEAMRASVAFLLDTEGIRTKTYDSALSLLAAADALEPGCVITDIRMPNMTGLELVEEMQRRGVGHPVIVLTGHADVALAVQAMKAGVIDFLEKPFENAALLRAVRTALDHGQAQHDRAVLQTRVAQLTLREREVFDAVVAGESNKTTALKLGISPRTVEIYRANVMAKMHANSLSDLVRMAMHLEEGR